MRRSALVLSVMLGVSCDGTLTEVRSPVRPIDEIDGLRVELSLDRTLITAGDSGVLTIGLRNTTELPVRLNFGSSCQILPYIETAAGSIEYPGGGAWGCAAMLTRLDVPPFGVVTRTVVVRRAAPGGAAAEASLPPGAYRAYAVLEHGPYDSRMRSQAVGFEVR